ncbi:alpha/beta hydrolase [Actinoplanes sp. NPDC048967]|uniref:alpha/beta hydrolase n=1 Tax=Actinoplanes sp. NPDC048967 TaxID=3155269 RepID=UPI0034114405
MDIAVKITGDGPAVLLIHGGAEDASMLDAQAEAIAARGFRAIWYDRRGTGGSTRDDWPGGGADQHADDAARLLGEVGAVGATVLGFSSGGTVALALAARHPSVAGQVIAWEPAALGVLPDGPQLQAAINAPGEAYLAEHPGDWVGAAHVLLDVLSEGRADHSAPQVTAMMANAEAMLRDDGHFIVNRGFAPGELPAELVTIAVGEQPDPLHSAIAATIAGLVGQEPVVVKGADDHEVYLFRPEILADWLAARRV